MGLSAEQRKAHAASIFFREFGGTLEKLHEAIEREARAAKAQTCSWQPIEKMPKDGEFLILVWEGEWRNPEKVRKVYHAYGFEGGAQCAGGRYRTEEGDAYKIAGWMPIPE